MPTFDTVAKEEAAAARTCGKGSGGGADHAAYRGCRVLLEERAATAAEVHVSRNGTSDPIKWTAMNEAACGRFVEAFLADPGLIATPPVQG